MKIRTLKKSSLFFASALFAAIVIATIQSCVKDNFDFKKLAKTEWNPNIAVPLVYSSLTVQDILTKDDKKGIINIGSDNFCTLIYKGNLFSLIASDLIKIPDQSPAPYSASLTPVQIAAFSSAGTITVPYSQTITFISGSTIPTPKVDSLVFKAGNINVSLNSSYKYSGQIVITIPSAKKGGVVFSKTMPLNYTGTTVISSANYDLTGYSFNMTMGGTTFNQFVVNYVVTLTGSGTPPLPSDQITLTESLTGMQFDRVFGDIGQESLSPNLDTVGISIFKNAIGSGTFTLVDPSVKISISNSYGVPILASIAKLDGYNPGVGTYPITGSPNPIPISSPTFSQIGQVLTTSYTLTSTNSNIVTVVNNTPKNLIYKVNSLSNPAGPTHTNFVLDTSKFKVDMELDLPLWGTAKDFILIDTIPFKMDQKITTDVESATLRTYNSNGFPIDVDVQIYFIDSLYTKLDSLIIPGNQLILKSASVNSSGIVTSPTEKVYDAVLTNARFQKMKTTKYILIVAKASTTSGGANVKIYSTYRLDVKLGLQVQIKKKI